MSHGILSDGRCVRDIKQLLWVTTPRKPTVRQPPCKAITQQSSSRASGAETRKGQEQEAPVLPSSPLPRSIWDVLLPASASALTYRQQSGTHLSIVAFSSWKEAP